MWILPDPPPDFIDVLAIDRHGQRELYYQRTDDRHDLFDAPITIVVTFDDQSFVREFVPGEHVDVHGYDAYVHELRSDGDHYGTGINWVDDQGRWVTIHWRTVPPPPENEIIDLANSAVAIEPSAWAETLLRLDPDVVIGRD